MLNSNLGQFGSQTRSLGQNQGKHLRPFGTLLREMSKEISLCVCVFQHLVQLRIGVTEVGHQLRFLKSS